MKVTHEGPTLSVSEIPELSAVNSNQFRDRVQSSLPPSVHVIEVDLSETQFMDSCGLGALFALYKATGQGRNGVALRILNPTPPVLQLFELTQMHRLFEIARR